MTVLHALVGFAVSVVCGGVAGYAFRGKELAALKAANAALQGAAKSAVSAASSAASSVAKKV